MFERSLLMFYKYTLLMLNSLCEMQTLSATPAYVLSVRVGVENIRSLKVPLNFVRIYMDIRIPRNWQVDFYVVSAEGQIAIYQHCTCLILSLCLCWLPRVQYTAIIVKSNNDDTHLMNSLLLPSCCLLASF